MTRGTAIAWAALALTAVDAELAQGAVGDPPTMDYQRCTRDLRPCGDPVVLGEASYFNGPLEIVGMSSRLGLCLGLDHVDTGAASQSCGGAGPVPPAGGSIIARRYGIMLEGSHRRYATEVSAFLSPEAAAVKVKYWRSGTRRVKPATVVQVSGDLLAAVGETDPFGVAELTVPGCIPPRLFRFAAFTSEGAVLQMGQALPRYFTGCGNGGRFDKPIAARRSTPVGEP